MNEEQERLKPVCENCMYMIEEKYFNTCKPIGGIIPKECADNLTCVSKCHSQPNFVPKGYNDPEAYKKQRYGDRYFKLPSPEEFKESLGAMNTFLDRIQKH